jgi:superfamily II DNA or RNA helicase
MAPIKLGFTATLPDDQEGILALEGIVGPVIGELTIQEATGLGIMAEPFITFINTPYNVDIGEYRRYRELYTQGIVNNRTRNGLLVKAVSERIRKGLTCLIMVKEIEHGENIKQAAELAGVPITFMHGGTKGYIRNNVRKMLNDKEIKCVITTDIWREGVDIPTLNVVVNACGGKSEIGTLQAIGRGARRTEEKDRVEIIDFLDPYRYLAEHTVRRLQIYKQNNWI